MVAATLILGFIGLIKLPLDFMTITVASITIGIAVDDTIHYMHRFQSEVTKIKDYREAIINTHTSIGKAMYHTSLIIIAGFSILVLSNFNPSMYFGLLTGLAMFIALACDLVLLPALLKIFKPYKI
jgi:predicted RND superfamily exporter protein